METNNGEFMHVAPGCAENCMKYKDGQYYAENTQQYTDFGTCCSSVSAVSDAFNSMDIQRQACNSSNQQSCNGMMMPGTSLRHNGTMNFGYSYNPQSFDSSMKSYQYDRPCPYQRYNHSQCFDSSTGSYRMRNFRRRRPMGYSQENVFGHSFSGSGISSNGYFDKSYPCSTTYGSSNDSGMYNFKNKRNVGSSGMNYNARSSINSCSCYSLKSSTSRLPLTKNESTFQLGICPSFLLTNHCIFFPNCALSHSRNDFEDMSTLSSEGQSLQSLVIPTQECKHFSVSGKCPIGFCCNFIHKMPKIESEIQNDETTITPSENLLPVTDEDIFHEFFLDNEDDDINQCFDIDKVYIDDKF